MKDCLISVVIPLFNKERYVRRALESVCKQTIDKFEIIVIDDGSTDNSYNIAKDFHDQRISIFYQKNLGVSAARNKGIKMANSELVAFLDADDSWMPWFLETILRLRSNYPKAGAYATNYELLESNGILHEQKIRTIPPFPWEGILENYFKSAAEGEFPLTASSVCIPKYVFNDVGGFIVGEKHGEDLDMWCKIALKYPIAYSTRISAIYHRESDNRVCEVLPDKEMPVLLTVRQAIANWSGSTDGLLYLRKYLAWLQIDMAKKYILRGKRKEGVSLLTKCETYHFPLKKIQWLILGIMPKKFTYAFWRLKLYLNSVIDKKI